MLDLQARIRFNEVVLASALIQQKLNGTETAILDGLGQFDCVLTQRLTCLRVQCRTGGDFDQLLMAPLHTTLAFAQVTNSTASITDHLHFDMPGLIH